MTSLVTDYLLIDWVRQGLGEGGIFGLASMRLVWEPNICLFLGLSLKLHGPNMGHFFHMVSNEIVRGALWVGKRVCSQAGLPIFWLTYLVYLSALGKYTKLVSMKKDLILTNKYKLVSRSESAFICKRILFSRSLLNDLKAIYNKKAPSQVMSELQPSLLEAVHVPCLCILPSNMNCIIKL